MRLGNVLAIAFLLLLCFCSPAASQPIARKEFKTLTVAEGLPQSFISGLAQDSTGFVWIGTRDGLARYDGKKFKIFRHKQGDTASLADNIISTLYLDKQDRLWIIYEAGGIDLLYTKTEALFHFSQHPLYRSVYSTIKFGQTITEDAKGNTWMLCSNGGVLISNLNKQTVRFYSDTALGLQNNKITGITESNGNVVLVTDTALVTIDENKVILKVVPYSFSDSHLYNPLISKNNYSLTRKTGEMIIQDETRLIVYHPAGNLFTVIPLPKGEDNLIVCMAKDNEENIFFGFNSDIFILTPENKVSIWKPKKENPPLGARTMLVDRSGVLWLGANAYGIQLHDLRLSRWSGQSYEKNFHIDLLRKTLKVDEAEIKKTFLYTMYPYNLRWLKDTDGKIWFSKAVSDPSRHPQLCYYQNGHLSQPEWHYTDTSASAHININAMAFSRSGKLWGLDFFLRPVYIDTLTHAVKVFPSVLTLNFNLEYTVNSLLIEGEDVFWISTAFHGLYRYDKRTKKAIHFSETNGVLPTNQLMNLVQDPFDSNVLWIGSLGGGLIQFNKTTGRCRSYTTNNGLPNNTVYAVIVDSKGILWCSSNKGIFSFNAKTGAVRNFTSKDGLPGDEFNRYHFLQLPDGQIAFGGVTGYTVFDPLRIADDTFQPPVAITGIRINNAQADFGYAASPFKAAINSLGEISLPYYQNFLSFEFAALQYNITEKLQYRYQLEGVDEDWVFAGNDNIATYTKIAPGGYKLKINAANTSGEWSTLIKTLSVTIQPPFWKTAWFTGLWIAAVIAVTYFLIRYRIAAVRKEEQQKARFEREAVELKAQALRAQMNPHFVFNCLNSIKALIQEDNKQQAVIYLTTFSKLIRSQLNNAQQQISLYNELETCRLYTQLEALRFGSKISCNFQIEEGVDTHSLQVPPLILQPFIENAIWHGILPKGGGSVSVSVSGRDDFIQCVIEDDGIGREVAMLNKAQKSAVHESKGLNLVQGRLSLHNIINNGGGSIELIDKKDQHGGASGTQVIVKFKKET